MGTSGFIAAAARHAPLVSIFVSLCRGINYVEATARINSVADDFELRLGDYCDKPYLRSGTATKEALERLFGWRLRREPMPDQLSIYWWVESGGTDSIPPEFQGLIESVGFEQPGSDDDGQPYDAQPATPFHVLSFEQLLPLLAPFHQWVDDLLARHASQAHSPRTFGFKHLLGSFHRDLLESARFVVVKRLPKFPFRRFGLPTFPGMTGDSAGVTFRNTYFLTPHHAQDEVMHFHELVHVLQHQLLGRDLFPLIYATEALANGCRANFLEAMAYDLQWQFAHAGGKPLWLMPIVTQRFGLYLPPLLSRAILSKNSIS
ncbi:MAG TPA: hypothetical protein VHM90_07980 [Phycisphaerae bacterium]|nr:hypothetical protein [Phycisphaerae bacterium]